MSDTKNYHAASDKMLATFKPKTGSNKHWFYKHINDVTPQEKKQADIYFSLFFEELRAKLNIKLKNNEHKNSPRSKSKCRTIKTLEHVQREKQTGKQKSNITNYNI